MKRLDQSRASGGVPLGEGLFAAGLEPRLANLLEQMPQQVLTVEPRRPFREPGSPRDETIYVRSGLICKYKTDDVGRRQIIALRFPGEGLVPRDSPADYGLQAIVRSVIQIGKAVDFNPIIEANPEIHRFFAKMIMRHASIGYEWLVNCGRRDTNARVAHLLCETAQRSGVDIDRDPLVNPFTQQQIADITGQTSVNVNRVFAELERNGLIRREGRRIFFTDRRAIERLAGFQHGYLE